MKQYRLLFSALLLLVFAVSNTTQAQNVTMHPGNGSMLPALKSGEEDTFFGWNGFATWKHEQLSLTLTTGDSDNNSSGTDADGNLARPANDIFASADGKCLQIGKGNSLNTYLTVSLPKGYRFTGYTIKFHRISAPNGAPSSGVNNYNGNISFGETNNTFTYRTTNNTTDQNITTYRDGIDQNNTTKYTIGRTATDMDNVLYFMLYNGAVNGRAFIQLDEVEFLFTAENNYAPLIPAPNVTNKSAVDIPFTTSKMDYGELKRYNIDGDEVTTGGRVSYDGTIHDMNANLILYENGSVKSVTAAENDFDGIAGYVVDYKSGSISQAGDYFKLKASDHGQYNASAPGTGATQNGEVIYYIESPVWATNKVSENAHKNPIGYRIIGADFDYTGGNVKFPAVFKIQYESTGHSADQNGTYGLNLYNGQIAYNWNYQSEWRIDDDGYIYNGQYWLQTGYGNNSTTLSVTTTKPSASRGTFEIVTNNDVKQIRRKSNTSYYIGWNETTWNGNITRTAVMTNNSNRRATYTELSHAFSENIGQYTFNIYDKTGTTVKKTVTVNGNSGTLSIDSLNNDAVKIGVIGTGIIKGHITLQALDPYIDHLDIVCQEKGTGNGTGNGGRLTQQFTATDFSVRGGKFTFYVPEDFTFPAQFTFENLYSKYGDNSYYNANNDPELHGRYYFMGSIYSGYEDNDVYARYNNTAHRNADYTTKIACLQPGNKKFTFNNAATATSTTGSQYEEYAFTRNKYIGAPTNGTFKDFEFSQDEMTDGTVKTAYLFTCDETRYNIAPTTATQHVYYAFYEMTIDMKKKDYRPIFDWVKIYDETFYSPNGSDIIRDPQWGLKLTTEDVTDDQGTHSGYLTVSKILDVIQNGLPAQQGSPAVQGLDNTGTNAPKSMNQILYIDGSNLMNIVENQTTTDGTTTTHRLSSLKEGLAANALIYLPYGSTSSDDNFAYNTVAQYSETPFFRGAGNVVITDKNPFFAPYDIQVDAQKYAEYQRQITHDKNGLVDLCTVILPFSIDVTEVETEKGTKYRHSNNDNTRSFYLHQINEDKALVQGSQGTETNFEYGHGYFGNPRDNYLERAGQTITVKANVPYVVAVEGETSEDEQLSFIAKVNGAKISATPWVNDQSLRGILTGETASATVDGSSISFTNKGTYRGKEILNAKNASEKVFYFAKNYFLNSTTLVDGLSLKILPFRAFYDYTGNASGVQGFRFVFGENETDPSSVAALKRDADLAVTAGKGTITFMAKADNDVAVISTNGTMVNKVSLKAGETRTIQLPAGIYLINGTKIVVR